jgi:hypothetical protein
LNQVLREVVHDTRAVSVLGLVVLGVTGVAYKTIRTDGWLSQWLAALWGRSPWLVWLAGFGITAALLASRYYLWRGSSSAAARGNLVAYAFIALGLFFFFKLMLTGSL